MRSEKGRVSGSVGNRNLVSRACFFKVQPVATRTYRPNGAEEGASGPSAGMQSLSESAQAAFEQGPCPGS